MRTACCKGIFSCDSKAAKVEVTARGCSHENVTCAQCSNACYACSSWIDRFVCFSSSYGTALTRVTTYYSL